MKKILTNTIATLAVIGGLAASMFAPWWAVWLICFPAMYAGAITLISRNTDWITHYGSNR